MFSVETVDSKFIAQARDLRRRLHQYPELSNKEQETARRILDFFQSLQPDQTWTGIGGHGVAFAFDGVGAGPTVLFRCELDALPIQELSDCAHRSRHPGCGHHCGHDGHMSIIATLGLTMAQRRPSRGRVILLFQPAEETGEGAGRVVADAQFAEMHPDYAFALHNMPGHPLGEINVRAGCFNCASRGMIVRLDGKTAHAAQPEDGLSPATAMCDLVTSLPKLAGDEPFCRVTVVHAKLGEVAFGTSPGQATVMTTLRTETDEAMRRLVDEAVALTEDVARRDGLDVSITWCDDFAASINHPEAVSLIERAVEQTGVACRNLAKPHRWSEDFGLISATCTGAMFGLGAGETHAALHHPDYDFPDELIEVGASVFLGLVDQLLEGP